MNITIVVPVYNSVNTLERCIKSIVDQTYKNFICLLIDDGSKDESYNLCKQLIQNDSRFVLIHQENQGVSKTRNKGIDECSTDFICFVDSDDELEENYLLTFMQNVNKADFVFSGIKEIYTDKIISYCENDILFNRNDLLGVFDKYLSLPFIGGPYNKIFRTKIIKDFGITFEVNESYAEDLMFNLKYMQKCNSYFFCNEVTYLYYKDTLNSLSKKKWDIDYLWKRRMLLIDQYLILFNGINNNKKIKFVQYLFFMTIKDVFLLKQKNKIHLISKIVNDYNAKYGTYINKCSVIGSIFETIKYYIWRK